MFSIGEFSKITGLTVKTLRFYHEQGILQPSYIEPGSGYRFYNDSKIETARVIAALRELEFSIAEIKSILTQYEDDADILDFMETRRAEICERIRNDRRIAQRLDNIITKEREASQKMSTSTFNVEEKTVPPLLVASIRMTGKYGDCGKGFGKIGRAFGRFIAGKPMLLCHDKEYRADDATFDAAMPVKKGESTDEITVHELPGGRCLTLMHVGPYEELSRSYETLLKHANAHDIGYSLPTREVYHKGPGIIFRGNPRKYLTEIQLMISEGESLTV